MSAQPALVASSPREEVAVLEREARDVGGAYCDAVDAVAALAEQLAALDHRIDAARTAAGMPRQVPTLRDHAAQVVLGSLAPLRPHVPFASDHARRVSEAALRRYGAV